MRELIKLSKKVCASCKYRMRFGSSPGREHGSYNYCCNYFEIEGRSRIFENGKKAYDAKYCDKYEKGRSIETKINWNQRNLRSEKDGRGKTDDYRDF